MEDCIWIVVNAGGNRREKAVADKCDARACQELTERRIRDEADILAEGPYRQALSRKNGNAKILPAVGSRCTLLQHRVELMET